MEGSEGSGEAAERVAMRWQPGRAAVDEGEEPEEERSEADRHQRRFIQGSGSQRRFCSATGSPRRLSSASACPSSAAGGAMQAAMAKLEDEFRHILVSRSSEIDIESLLDLSSVSLSSSLSGELSSGEQEDAATPQGRPEVDSEGSSTLRRSSHRSIREIDLLPPDSIQDLREIAIRMIAAGYGRECVQVYGSARKPAVDQSLRRLGVEKMSIGDVQRLEWELVESKIRRWIRSARSAVRVIFASERHLCELLFDAGLDDAPFAEAVKGAALQLFGFAEAIAIGRRSPEKLFKIIDLHDALSDLLPDIAAIFYSKSTESIRLQTEEILSRLADAVRGILSEFESAVLRDPKSTVPGGTIHPLTRYVMNYITLISSYKSTLARLITSRPSNRLSSPDDPISPELDFPQMENQSPLSSHLVWIIVVLHHNLSGKSDLYKDPACSHIFLMNNVHYIVHKVKDSPELCEMIGDDYLRRLTRNFQQAAIKYQRATLVKILNCLRDEGIHVSGGFSSGISKSTLRERFRAFNSEFDMVHKIHSTWQIPDMQLKEELRISISEKIVPAYRSFLGRFRQHIESGKHPEMYIKYSAEDLETVLLDLFEGRSPSPLSRRRSN